jgi:glycine cleavage system H protein
MRFSRDHVWVRPESSGYRIGLTEYAQQELGEITFIELPDPGSHFQEGDSMCAVDSLKSSSDVYAPFHGTVVEVNSSLNLENGTKAINIDPTDSGWILIVRADSDADYEALMDSDAYRAFIGA